DIWHDVVGQFVFEDGHEIPFGVAAFAPGNGRTDLVAHLLERIDAFRRYGLLEPVDVAGFLQFTAAADGCGHVKTTVGINENIDVRSGGFADEGGEFGRFAGVLAAHGAVEVAVALFAGDTSGPEGSLVGVGVEFQRGVAGSDDVPD